MHYSNVTDIYMLPSNLDLNIEKTVGSNNTILISNTGMKIGSIKMVKKLTIKCQKHMLPLKFIR